MKSSPESMAAPQDLGEEIISASPVRRRRKHRRLRHHELKKKLRRVLFILAQALLIALAIYIWTRIAE